MEKARRVAAKEMKKFSHDSGLDVYRVSGYSSSKKTKRKKKKTKKKKLSSYLYEYIRCKKDLLILQRKRGEKKSYSKIEIFFFFN